LDDDRTANSFDRAVEYRKKTVSRIFDNPSVVLSDSGLDEFATVSLDPRVRPLLIDRHEPAVAGDIGGQYGCETPRRSLGWIRSTSPLPDVMDLTCHLSALSFTGFVHSERDASTRLKS
jgi:hypothetical protein